jgi:acetyltransferase
MEIEEIRRVVQATIRSIAPETDFARIAPDLPLREQIDLDSIDWLNVIASLHDRVSVDIPERDYGRLTSLDAIVAYLASSQAALRTERLGDATPDLAQLPCTHYVVDGTDVVVRPLRSEDLPLKADFVRHLSPETRYGRFMVTVNELPPDKLSYLTDVDQVRHVALAATVRRDGEQALIGVVRYVVDLTGHGCEFAIALEDAWQRSGLAGILMHALMRVARARGLATMEGLVLATNTRMLKFTRQLGFEQTHSPEDRDTIRVVRSL